jgi:hypothetical protein
MHDIFASRYIIWRTWTIIRWYSINMTHSQIEIETNERISPRDRRLLRREMAQVADMGLRIHDDLVTMFAGYGSKFPINRRLLNVKFPLGSRPLSTIVLGDDHSIEMMIPGPTGPDMHDSIRIDRIERTGPDMTQGTRIGREYNPDRSLRPQMLGMFVVNYAETVDGVISERIMVTGEQNGYANDPRMYVDQLHQDLITIRKDIIRGQ